VQPHEVTWTPSARYLVKEPVIVDVLPLVSYEVMTNPTQPMMS